MLSDPSARDNAPQAANPAPHLTKSAQLALTPDAMAVDESPVSCIMTRDVHSFSIDTTLEEATRLMLTHSISGAPVTDENGRPVGIVSKTDLLEAWQQRAQSADKEGQGPQHPVRRAVDLQDAGPDELALTEADSGVVVGDIMVPYLLAVSQQAPIALAAALMAYEGVHRLLVLNDNNEMVGIVSTLDVLRWLAQLTGFCLPRHTQRQRG